MNNFHDILPRIGPFATIDILLTILAMEYIYRKRWIRTSRIKVYGIGILIGIVVHALLGVRTPLNSLIGI